MIQYTTGEFTIYWEYSVNLTMILVFKVLISSYQRNAFLISEILMALIVIHDVGFVSMFPKWYTHIQIYFMNTASPLLYCLTLLNPCVVAMTDFMWKVMAKVIMSINITYVHNWCGQCKKAPDCHLGSFENNEKKNIVFFFFLYLLTLSTTKNVFFFLLLLFFVWLIFAYWYGLVDRGYHTGLPGAKMSIFFLQNGS